MSSVEITKTVKGDKKEISIDNVNNELIFTYYNKATWRDFKVIPFSNSEIKKYLPSYKNVYQRYKEIVQKYDKNMGVEEAAS